MVNTKKRSGQAMSIPAGLMIAGVCSLIISVIGSIILGWMIDAEFLIWENAGYGIMLILFFASFLGSSMASAAIKQRRFLVSFLGGVTYYLILLLITTLFFGGKFYAMGITALLIFAGCGCSAMMQIREKGRRGLRKYKIRNC